jgi:hypothetical protein
MSGASAAYYGEGGECLLATFGLANAFGHFFARAGVYLCTMSFETCVVVRLLLVHYFLSHPVS